MTDLNNQGVSNLTEADKAEIAGMLETFKADVAAMMLKKLAKGAIAIVGIVGLFQVGFCSGQAKSEPVEQVAPVKVEATKKVAKSAKKTVDKPRKAVMVINVNEELNERLVSQYMSERV